VFERERGEARARLLGGNRRSGRVEAHKDTTLALIEETPDIPIKELCQALAEKGVTFGYGAIRRFLARRHAQKKTAHAADQDRPTS
jgi:transposase